MQKELCGGKRWKLQAEAKMGLLHLQGEKTNRTIWIWPCVEIQNTSHILKHFPMNELESKDKQL